MTRLSYVVRPLDPPAPPNPARKPSPFSAHWGETLDLLDRELWALGVRRTWVMQLDVPASQIRIDGGVYARATPRTPAVRVSFDSTYGPLTYGCDRYWDWQSNVRAVALSLEALRKVDRYGVADTGQQYAGWAAITAGPAPMTREVAAGLIASLAEPDQTERRDAARTAILSGNPVALATAYKAAARRAHPDAGGDHDTMTRLNQARDLLAGGMS